MSRRGRAEPVDPVVRDDQLLDALGRGELPAGVDALAQALYTWRSDLADQDSAGAAVGVASVPTEPVEPDEPPTVAIRRPPTVRPGVPDANRPRSPRRRRGERRTRRPVLVAAASAAFVAATFGGIAVAAANAQPGSPLWPVTKVVYNDRATATENLVDAQRALDNAEQAADDGRVGDALRYLNQAEDLAGNVRSSPDADELRKRANAVRAQLPAGGSGSPAASPATLPGTNSPEPSPSTDPDDPGSPSPTEDPEPTGSDPPGEDGQGQDEGQGQGQGQGPGKKKDKTHPAHPIAATA